MTIHHNRWGAKIGPRIAMLVSAAIIHTHQKLAATKHKLAMGVFNAASDQISDEVHDTVGQIARLLLDTQDIPDMVKPHLEQIAYKHGQLTALAGSSLASASILTPLAQILTNALAPYVGRVVGTEPNALPDPNTIAQIVARGVDTRHGTDWAMHYQGINDSWISDLIESSLAYPAVADATAMLNRGLIDEAEFHTYLRRNAVPDAAVARYRALADVPLSPADAALAVLRGNIDQSRGERAARSYGVSREDFAVLMGNTGEPPGTEQLLEAYRRGFIGQDELRRGILQSRVRNEWIPMLEQLRFTPMSTADAVNAVVQNHMTSAQAARIAEENGLTPGAIDILEQTAGEPLSRTEMEELYNRGLATRADVEQALRESRLKNKYTGKAFQLHERVLPARSVDTALRHGAVGDAEAIKIIMESGYSKRSAEIIVKSGAANRIDPYKSKVATAAQSLYEDGIIAKADALSITEAMGFTKAEAGFIARASEFHQQARAISAAVAAVRGKYLGHHISKTEASNLIDRSGIQASQRDYLIKLWSIERGAFTRTLTEAQTVKAVNKKLISEEDGITRLENMGYNKVDATLLIKGA